MRLSHIGWNLVGLSMPLLVAVATVPSLIERLGNERFGLLALAWGLVGYAGALDLGIGRAVTQLVSRMRGEGTLVRVPHILATAGRITLVSGVLGGALITALALIVGSAWIRVEHTSAQEVQLAMLLMALALPAQAMSATYRGLNEAYENFKGISVVRATLGIINFGGPYLVSLYTTNIAGLVGTIVASRLVALYVYRRLAVASVGSAEAGQGRYSRPVARQLFSFGGWVTVSSVISPILVQADRFVIGALISASAVAVYVVPYEVVVQSLILVGAITSATFPALTRRVHDRPDTWRGYFNRWLGRVAVMMAVVCLLLAAVLRPALEIWLGGGLNQLSVSVGQILCIGVFANSLGAMFYALLHAHGRADMTAKLHLIELPLFLVTLVTCVTTFGVEGAAWAWTARMILDAFALFILSRGQHA